MNHLYRELAPISAAAWQEIEKEAKREKRGEVERWGGAVRVLEAIRRLGARN